MKEIATNQAEIEAVAKLDEEHEFDPTSQTRAFTYARRCRKDPGSGWSRDSFKNLLLSEVGKVSNYMLPHTSDTFQIQVARCNGCDK